jgi:hypothetical protein
MATMPQLCDPRGARATFGFIAKPSFVEVPRA